MIYRVSLLFSATNEMQILTIPNIRTDIKDKIRSPQSIIMEDNAYYLFFYFRMMILHKKYISLVTFFLTLTYMDNLEFSD